MTKKKITGMRESEKDLCKAIASYLHIMSLSRNFIYMHIPNEYVKAGTSIAWEKNLISMGKLHGAPDYIVAKDGRCIFIEVKTATGRLSKSQVEVQRWCKEVNIPYYICRSIDDVNDALRGSFATGH